MNSSAKNGKNKIVKIDKENLSIKIWVAEIEQYKTCIKNVRQKLWWACVEVFWPMYKFGDRVGH